MRWFGLLVAIYHVFAVMFTVDSPWSASIHLLTALAIVWQTPGRAVSDDEDAR